MVWKIWTKIYCSARNLLVHLSSLSHTTYVETNKEVPQPHMYVCAKITRYRTIKWPHNKGNLSRSVGKENVNDKGLTLALVIYNLSTMYGLNRECSGLFCCIVILKPVMELTGIMKHNCDNFIKKEPTNKYQQQRYNFFLLSIVSAALSWGSPIVKAESAFVWSAANLFRFVTFRKCHAYDSVWSWCHSAGIRANDCRMAIINWVIISWLI